MNVRLNSSVVFSFNLFTVFLLSVIVTSTLSPFFKLLCLLKEISGFDNRLEISVLELVTSGTFLISTSGFPSPSVPYVMKLTLYVAKSITFSFFKNLLYPKYNAATRTTKVIIAVKTTGSILFFFLVQILILPK